MDSNIKLLCNHLAHCSRSDVDADDVVLLSKMVEVYIVGLNRTHEPSLASHPRQCQSALGSGRQYPAIGGRQIL
jgi:hypothetical protein